MSLTLSPEAVRRLRRCLTHIDKMHNERIGWGPEYQRPVERTRASLLHATGVLLSAQEVWPDGPDPSLSMGGQMLGGIVFGMIARERPLTQPVADAPTFRYPEIDWTFHS